MPSSLDRFPRLAAFLAGEDVEWAALTITPDDVLSLADEQDIGPLLNTRLSVSAHADQWPTPVRDALSQQARAAAAAELLTAREVCAVLEALHDAGVAAILLKGTPLAYSVYDHPSNRPRGDTDLIVRAGSVEPARRAMAGLGYQTTVHCSDLFSQFEVQKTDRVGVLHAFDVHWTISTQPVFGDALTFDELASDAEPVPALGPRARAAGATHALLLACIHPVMHHRNEERALWMYDIHLLASRLSSGDFNAFAELAEQKQMAAVCAYALAAAQNLFKTRVPAGGLSRLSSVRAEPSAEYLDSGRRWRDELLSSVRGLPTFAGRLRLLREVLFPSASYMLGAYGLRGKPLGSLLLPALYLHRNIAGALKIVAGKK